MKKVIRLTENQFYNLIEDTIKKVMEIDESKKNKKKTIRLTESQFYNLIENTIKKVMEIDEEKITFDGDEDDDEVRFEPIKKFQKGPRKMKKE